jgi:penicillin-binding protein 2
MARQTYTEPRKIVILAIMTTVVAILLVRLFVLQVLSPEYAMLAMGNAVYRKTVYPDRGIIFDRRGRPVLENTTTRDLMVLPTQAGRAERDVICRILGIDTVEYRQRLVNAIVKNGRYRPSVFEPTLGVEVFVKLQENAYRFEPGFFLQERPIRTYPYRAAAQILGYIGEVDSAILRRTNYFYQMGDYMGLNGLERHYEHVLMGVRGVSYQLRDNKNRIMGAYEEGRYDTAAKAGRNLRTYLDMDIQQLAERFLANKLGAVVAIEPRTGGIIAMASGPTYDPNQLTGAQRRRNFSWMLSDTARPLFNRAIKGQYPPGSTIKPMGALIALDEGVITPGFGYGCGGAYLSCGRPIRCTHAGGGHAADLRRAMANSCNAYFSHIFRLSVDNPGYMGVKQGYARWKAYANAFGMGVRLGVDLPSEDKGLIADTSFYDRLYRGVWNSCNNVFLGIGQGEMTATPLQMANLMAIIANKGYYYIPHFVDSIDGGGEADTILRPFRVRHEVTHIPAATYEEVQLGMQDVVDRGTARVARLDGIAVAAKTGTAENYGIINGKRVKHDDHSWFVAFAPRENPRIAIAVVVENAGFGATWAGPIASLLMERYLTDSLRPHRLAEVERIAAKEIMLPVIRQKRRRMDSLRRVRLSEAAADTPVRRRTAPPSVGLSHPGTPLRKPILSATPAPAPVRREVPVAPRRPADPFRPPSPNPLRDADAKGR